MRYFICGASLLLALLIVLYVGVEAPNNAPFSVYDGDIFFDFTEQDSHTQWHGSNSNLTISKGADCAADGRMLAYGTLVLSSTGNTLDLQTASLQYNGNKDDVYAEIRLKAAGFDGSKSGTVAIYPCGKDASDIRLTATISETDLTAGDYVTLRFTNATQFARWQSLDAIHNISVEFRYDGLRKSHSLTYDYIYIGSERQNHVMVDFNQSSPANTASLWTVRSTPHSRHNTHGVSTKKGYLYGTTSLDDSSLGYSFVTTENQFLYTVQQGDIVKLRAKFSRNSSQSGALQDLCIGLGVGGTGYWSGYKGTILNIPQLQIDGVYHEYTLKIPEGSNLIGKPLRSLYFGFVGRGGYTLDWEMDYIYVGSEINFSAYTGRSTIRKVPTPAEDDIETIDNSLVSFRLFRYNDRVNENAPNGVLLKEYFPFYADDLNSATVLPYLSKDGYPILTNGANLGCLFGEKDGVGVHSYTPHNSLLTFDGVTYSYDSTKHAVEYDTATDLFYVHREARDGFSPFYYEKELGNGFGFIMEWNFVQTSKDAVLYLSCADEAWVFIDGTLVLDLSGSKLSKRGLIHFESGEILYPEEDSLLERYQAAGREAVTSWDGKTFADGSIHTVKLFFLKRSNEESHAQLSFSLSPVASTDRHIFSTVPNIKSNILKSKDNPMQLWEQHETTEMHDEHHSIRLNYEIQVNGQDYPMGSIAKYGEDASITAFLEVYDPERAPIGTVELVGEKDISVFRTDIRDSYAYFEIPLTTEQACYYVRVTSADKQHTTTHPIWLKGCNSHSPAVLAPLAPTCTIDGKADGIRCSACYTVLKPQAVLPATGHSLTYTVNDTGHSIACEQCVYSVSEEHNFTNGVCICGIAEVTAPILDGKIRILHTLNLESSIVLNYAVSVSELRIYDSFYLQCVLPEFDGNVQIGTSSVEIQPILNGNYYYFPLTGLSAVRMNDTIQATVIMRKDGVSYCTVVDHYSIADYAYAMLNSAKAEDSLKVLCADLLRYGAEAQIFKAYRTDAPVDAKMTLAHRSYLSDTSTLQFHVTDKLLGDGSIPAITWVGTALTLDSKVGLKLVFHSGGYDGEKLVVKLSYQDYSGTERSILLHPTVYNASAGYYAVTCYELTAAELRTIITAAVYKGERQLSESLQYSAESYAAKTDGTALDPLCKALFAYSDSAYAYFAK